MSSMRLTTPSDKTQASLVDLATGLGRSSKDSQSPTAQPGFENNFQRAVQKKMRSQSANPTDSNPSHLPVTPAKDHHALGRAPEANRLQKANAMEHARKLRPQEKESAQKPDEASKPTLAKPATGKQMRPKREAAREDASPETHDMNRSRKALPTEASGNSEATPATTPASGKEEMHASSEKTEPLPDDGHETLSPATLNTRADQTEIDQTTQEEEYLSPTPILSEIPASEWAGTMAQAFLNLPPEEEPEIEIAPSAENWVKTAGGPIPASDPEESFSTSTVDEKVMPAGIDVQRPTPNIGLSQAATPPVVANANAIEISVSSDENAETHAETQTSDEGLVIEQKTNSEEMPLPVAGKESPTRTVIADGSRPDKISATDSKAIPFHFQAKTPATESQANVETTLPAAPLIPSEALRALHALAGSQDKANEGMPEHSSENATLEIQDENQAAPEVSLVPSQANHGEDDPGSHQPPAHGQSENPLQALHSAQARWNSSTQNPAPSPFSAETPATVTKDSLSQTAHLHDLQNFLRREIDSKAATLWRQGQDEIHLQLMPEHLGKVHVSLEMREGSVNAKIHVQSEAAKQAVDQGLQQLRDSLSQHGFKIENLSVSVEDRHAGLFNPDGKDSQQFFRHREEGRANASSLEEEMPGQQETAAVRWMGYNTLEIVA